MNVLVACECSGIVRDAFRAKGHEAWSCDLPGVLVEGIWTDKHLYGDCFYFLEEENSPVGKWDLLIAHPPCTYLANSGVVHLDREDDRWDKMCEAIDFFNSLYEAPVEHVCVENPIMHGYAAKYVNGKYTQKIQPYEFGHPESKATCLWLRNLPELKPTKVVKPEKSMVNGVAGDSNQQRNRSRTYRGIANAMADQWGSLDG